MAVSAHDIAEEFRRRLGDVGAVKLQKLLYYAQGWHLAHTDQPLFEEAIQAWADGPVVVADLCADERHRTASPSPRAQVDSAIAAVEYVAERYGHLSGPDLIRTTQNEGPCRELSASNDPATRHPEITHAALARWFRNDEDYKWFQSEVERLRRRTDIYSFGPLERTPDFEAAIARAQSGERIHETRPG